MGLYTDFKKYYIQSKSISENANEIIKLLSEENNRNLFVEIQSLYKDLNLLEAQSNKTLNYTNRNIVTIKSLLEQLFIPIKNLKQNLSTLKFLIANINLNGGNFSSRGEMAWDDIVAENTTIIDKYRDHCLLNEKFIFGLELEITNLQAQFDKNYNRNCNDLEELLNNIHYGIIFFAEKHEEVKRQIPELTTKTENNSQSIADIITNLQYHDIIRQKIEHIQQNHKKILSELNDINSTDAEKEKLLLQKIKDIAGLQAAMLVSANKEYQLAIEKITKKFLEIGDNMHDITSICLRLNDSKDDSGEVHFIGMLDRLNNSEQMLFDFTERSKSYFSQINDISIPLHKTIDNISKLIESSKNFSKSTNNIISIFSQSSQQEASSKTTLSHIIEVCEDISQFERNINNVYTEIVRNENELLSNIKLYSEKLENHELIINSVRNINSIISKLNEKSIYINFLLEHNIKESATIIDEIKESIKRIRYYDLFEKSINNIIEDLRNIHIKLKGKTLDENMRKENMNSVKHLYTMKTEHDIHEEIISKIDVDEDEIISDELKIDEKDKSKHSDEVEFF